MSTVNSLPRPKNWLLMKFRQWHIRLGVAVSLFVVLVCMTGIYLNHQGLFAPGDARLHVVPGSEGTRLLTTRTVLDSHPVSFQQVMGRAAEQWGDVEVETLHLKSEDGAVVYKVKARDGREIVVDASTGAFVEKTVPNKLGRIIKDLHTGKIAGGVGKLFVDFTSLTIIGLTATGVYLWVAPKWRKRKAGRRQPAPSMAE